MAEEAVVGSVVTDEDLENDPISEWVTFGLQSEKYGIPVIQVKEVLKISEIAPVPGAPGFVLGIINLRGNVVTVIDSRKRFGLPPVQEYTDTSRIMIVESDDETVGMLVDRVAEVADIRVSQIETAPNVGNEHNAEFIHGVTNQNDELVILVDLDKFLSLAQYRTGAIE